MTLSAVADGCRAAGVPYLSRRDSGLTLPLGPAMTLPAAESWVHHSVTIADDDHSLLNTEDVVADMREIEVIGRQRFGRFPYSWCVHPSGVIGEGAGFNIGAHTADHNSRSFGICAIGNYETADPPAPMIRAFAVLLAVLERTGALVKGSHPTGGHRDTKQTACPGGRLYARLGDIRRLADDPSVLNPTQPLVEDPTMIPLIKSPYNGRIYVLVSGRLIHVAGPAGLPPAARTFSWQPDVKTFDNLARAFGPAVE